MLINQQNLQRLYVGFRTTFNNAFAGATPQWNRVAMRVPSNTKAEQYGWLRTSTRFREWIGDRVIQNLSAADYTIRNKSWENTVAVDREDIEDDTFGVYTPIIENLGRDAAVFPDELVFGLLAAGFTTPCWDGQFFFDVDHPVLNAAGQEVSLSNFQGGSGTPWFLLDTNRPIRPLVLQVRKDSNFVRLDKEDDPNVFFQKKFIYGVDNRMNVGYGLWQMAYASRQPLTVANYTAARAAMMSFKGDHDKRLGIMPNLLVVPPALEADALTVVRAELVGQGNTNVMRGTAEVLATPWLA